MNVFAAEAGNGIASRLMHQRRPATLSTIAKLTGYSHSTVSRALRNHPRIPESTKLKIQNVAKKLNYTPNPFFTLMAKYHGLAASSRSTAVMGFLVDRPTDKLGWLYTSYQSIYQGARDQAAELGFKLDLIHFSEEGLSGRRLTQILRTRGVQGLIICPITAMACELEMEWESFSPVTVGHTLKFPALHRVSEDYFSAIRETLSQVYTHGYKRPGFVLTKWKHERNNRVWLSAFLLNYHEKHGKDVPPVLFYTRNARDRSPEFLQWWNIQNPKPDCLIFVDSLQVDLFLGKLKWNFPKDVGIAILRKEDSSEPYSGVMVDYREIGAAAFSMVLGMIHRNETGLPRRSHYFAIQGEWSEGSSL